MYLRFSSGEGLSIFRDASVHWLDPRWRPAVLSPFTAKQTANQAQLWVCMLHWATCDHQLTGMNSIYKMSQRRTRERAQCMDAYLRRYPNMRKRTQKMMQAVPIWMPMTMLPSEASPSLHWHRRSPPGNKPNITDERPRGWNTAEPGSASLSLRSLTAPWAHMFFNLTCHKS